MTKFGTDGIRGIYKKDITVDLAFKIGFALAKTTNGSQIIVGRDNRPGSKELLSAVCCGIQLGGGVATTIGLCTTPCISFLAETGFDYGIMITASHNPPEYNGIKIISSGGTKLDHQTELSVENMIDNIPKITQIGKIVSNPRLKEKYINYLRLILPKNNLKIVVDCSKGASQKMAKKVFKKSVIFTGIGCGKNINKNCGATHPNHLQKIVQKHSADIGFAFDGDADRVIVATKNAVYDGDNILFLLAKYYKDSRKSIKSVVSTIMSNMGLEIELKKLGINLIRTQVGDKYVIEEMQKQNLILGGEQAGHIILSEFVKSGDGMLVSLVILHAINHFETSIDSLFEFERIPQTEVGIKVRNKDGTIANELLQEKIAESLEKLGQNGRLVVRASGTEPKIRVMVECKDKTLTEHVMTNICETIKRIDLCVE